MDKANIRKQIIAKRDGIDLGLSTKLSDEIKNKVINTSIYKKAKSIFIFIGFGSEVNTIGIIKDALREGKEVYVPKIENRVMKVIRIKSLDTLKPGVFGILEPMDGKELKGNCDLIFMPGVAFTKNGCRLGYGGGYYDKYLAEYNTETLKIALAYSMQIVDFVPTESYDKKVDYIVTEDVLYHCEE